MNEILILQALHLLLECFVLLPQIGISLDLLTFSQIAEIHIRMDSHPAFLLSHLPSWSILLAQLLDLNALSLVQILLGF